MTAIDFLTEGERCPMCGVAIGSGCLHFSTGKGLVALTVEGLVELVGAEYLDDVFGPPMVAFRAKDGGKAGFMCAEWIRRGAQNVFLQKKEGGFWYVHVDLPTVERRAIELLKDRLFASDDPFIAAFEGVG